MLPPLLRVDRSDKGRQVHRIILVACWRVYGVDGDAEHSSRPSKGSKSTGVTDFLGHRRRLWDCRAAASPTRGSIRQGTASPSYHPCRLLARSWSIRMKEFWVLSSLNFLIELGFDLDPNDFFLVDPCDEPALLQRMQRMEEEQERCRG